MQDLKFLIINFSAAAILFSCHSRQADAANTDAPVTISDSMAKMIKIDTAGTSNIGDELKLSGEVSFNDNKVVKVFPFGSGRIINVKVSFGDKVSKGQVLAVIKSADVAGNYSDLSLANNDIAIAKKEMDNQESLYKNGIASEREFIVAKESYQKALTAAQKVHEQISINGGGHTAAGGTYTVIAPISGYVVEKKINEGAFIRGDNADNMFTIGDISDVWIWANVYETDIARVKEGYTATVTTLAYPDKIFTGIVDKVNQVLDPVTKVMRIRIKLPNPELKLKPEMFANITIQNKEGAQATAIPASAIISEDGKNYVVLYRSDKDLAVQEVSIIKTIGDKTYISSGLKVGDKVISAHQLLLFRALTEK